jgi:NADPH:quinone reductase-like Zn-dependent oxidoreductase
MAASIPATFQAFQYENHSANPLAEVKLNSSVAHKPLQPTQVRIKIRSAAVNPIDYKLVPYGAHFLPKPASKESPLTIGFDLSGVVVEVGSGDVKGFKVGDEVFSMPGLDNFGSFAEYINVDVKYIAPKPASLSFDEAAGVPLAGQTSYQALVTYGKLQAGQRVLILGGSSGTGIYAVQMAKAIGAHVIATASFRNADFVKTLGADEVIDYTKAKWSEVVAAGSIDLIYDCGFESESWNDEAQKVLKPQTGIFVTIGTIKEAKESAIGATVHQIFNQPCTEFLLEVTKFIDAGQLKVVIDSVHPFDKTLEAIERQMSERARGKIIIHIADQ